MSTSASPSFTACERPLLAGHLSSDDISAASVPSGAGIAHSHTTSTYSSPPGTPFSVGYPEDPDNDSPYSPPMASALLPGEPQTVKLMILTEYVTSLFKQVGNDGMMPTEPQRASMQKTLNNGRYSREDIELGFLHAAQIVCKAHTAFRAAIEMVKASGEGNKIEEVALGEHTQGFRRGGSGNMIGWDNISKVDVKWTAARDLRNGIEDAYLAVAEIKIGIREVFKRQEAAKAKQKRSADMKMEVDAEDEYEPTDDLSSTEDRVSGVRGKDGHDSTEVDSAYDE